MTDEAIPGRLVEDSMPPSPPGPVEQVVTAVKNLILPTHKELITQLRQGTPQKVRKVFQVPAGGTIGGGTANPDFSQVVYTAPESAEAWLHRITMTSPQHGPGAPLTTGAIVLVGTTFGEVIVMAPDNGVQNNTLPVQFIEGRSSAPHLDRGESLTISGGGLTPNDVIIIDLQIFLVTGLSEFTPRTMAPGDLTRKDSSDAF